MATLAVAALIGCGGGNDDESTQPQPSPGSQPPVQNPQGPLEYSGATSAAVVTMSNASGLLGAAIGGSRDVVGAVSSLAGSRSDAIAGQGLIDTGRRLIRAVRATASNPILGASATSIDVTDACPGGGTLRISGDLTSVGIRTISLVYASCNMEGDVLSGQATMTIEVILSSPYAGRPSRPAVYTITFDSLAVRGASNVDLTGCVRVQDYLPTNRETVTQNLVARYNPSGRVMKSENLIFIRHKDNSFSPLPYVETVVGRVFDGMYGYVDITTLTRRVFATDSQPFPNSGSIQLVGAAGSRMLAMAFSSEIVRLALDMNGDGVFEATAMLSWSQLSTPTGSDLGDNDGDGMHNSWETANWLSPNLKEAALDSDRDGFRNLAEYQGGGNPNNASIVPRMVVGELPVAGGIGDWLPHFPVPSAVASDGNNYLVVSCRPLSGLFGVFVSTSGQVSDSFPIADLLNGDECNQRPAVAFDGANFLVVFAPGQQIHGIRVTPAGLVVDTPFPISSLAFNWAPAVAFDGTNYLVVWSKLDFASSQNHIYGAIVSPGGSAAGEFAVSAGAFPALAFDGTNYLVVSSNDGHVHASRVTSTGGVINPSPIAIAQAPGGKRPGGVAFDGTDYFVVWDQEGKIFGRRVTPAAALLDGAASSEGIAISTGAFPSGNSSLAFAGNHFVVTWTVDLPEGTSVFAARVSTAGVRVDGSPTEPGVAISGSFMFKEISRSEHFMYPVAASNASAALIAWTRSVAPPSEESTGSNDILAALIFGL